TLDTRNSVKPAVRGDDLCHSQAAHDCNMDKVTGLELGVAEHERSCAQDVSNEHRSNAALHDFDEVFQGAQSIRDPAYRSKPVEDFLQDFRIGDECWGVSNNQPQDLKAWRLVRVLPSDRIHGTVGINNAG